jgi:hypothetical protein
MPHYTEKTGELPRHQMLAPNLLGRHPADQQLSTKHHTLLPQPPPGINQHSPLDRLTLPHKKKKKKKKKNLNQELKTHTQYRGQGAVSIPEKEGKQGADLHVNFQ